MLNVIICEDNKGFKSRTYDIVNQYLMNTNVKYKIKTFEKYDDKLKELIKNPKDGYTIYILDIQLDETASGIDIANDIRRNDYDSVIILETGTDLISRAQQLRLDIFHYIHKDINYNEELTIDIDKCLHMFNLKGTIKFKVERVDYNIKYDDVIMIEADSIERKCIVTTKTNQYEVKNPLIYFEKQLDFKFYKINRGCIVNVINIEKVNYDKNMIKFVNGKKIYGMIANSNKKGLKEHVERN